MEFLKDKGVWRQVAAVIAMAVAMFGVDIPPELQADIAVGIAAIAGVTEIIIRRFAGPKE